MVPSPDNMCTHECSNVQGNEGLQLAKRPRMALVGIHELPTRFQLFYIFYYVR